MNHHCKHHCKHVRDQLTRRSISAAGPSNLSNLCGETGNELLEYYGYSLSIGAVIGVLLGFYCLFHIGSYLALSRLYRTPQR